MITHKIQLVDVNLTAPAHFRNESIFAYILSHQFEFWAEVIEINWKFWMFSLIPG